VQKEMSDKAKAGELKEVDDRPDKKRRRWDMETGKTENNGSSVHGSALGAGSGTPSAATPGGGPRKRLAIDAADVRFIALISPV
jgi:hypothetical protein